MPTTFGIGFSQNQNGKQAALEAAEQAKTPFENRPIDFAILLITEQYEPRSVLQTVSETLGTKNIIGCSTTAIIHGKKIKTCGVSLLCSRSGEIFSDLVCTSRPMNPLTAKQEGAHFAKSCFASKIDYKKQFMISFIDGVSQDKAAFVQGVHSEMTEFFPIIGAGSCDNFKFRKSYQIFRNDILTQSAVGLILGGDFAFGLSTHHGWRPLGKPRSVDAADGNIVKTISGKPAVAFYEEFFDQSLAELMNKTDLNADLLYPLGVKIEGSKKYLIRKINKIYQDGGLLCDGNIPAGKEIHLMIGNQEACREATREAALDAKSQLADNPAGLVLIFQSIARLKLFGRSLADDIQEVYDVFSEDTPVWGMCSHGEIAPFQLIDETKQNFLQNACVILLAIS